MNNSEVQGTTASQSAGLQQPLPAANPPPGVSTGGCGRKPRVKKGKETPGVSLGNFRWHLVFMILLIFELHLQAKSASHC